MVTQSAAGFKNWPTDEYSEGGGPGRGEDSGIAIGAKNDDDDDDDDDDKPPKCFRLFERLIARDE